MAATTLKPINRQADDFYSTPRSTVEQLLAVEKFEGSIWESACGDGAISRVLQEHGHAVVSTDLVDRGYGKSGIDFLMERQALARNIVTNPPFKLGTEFATHAIGLVAGKVVMLLKIGFLEGPTRECLHQNLARVWIIRRRITFLKGGKEFSHSNGKGGIHAYAWFVWDRSHQGPVTLGWLPGEACK